MITFDEKTICLKGGRSFEVEHPVADALVRGDDVVVLYKPDSIKNGQFNNLVAFSKNGDLKWRAELPTSNSMDAYYETVSVNPLTALSYCSYRCVINWGDGKIVRRDFYK